MTTPIGFATSLQLGSFLYPGSVRLQQRMVSSHHYKTRAQLSSQAQTPRSVNTSTEDTFAIDAGRDLFFPGMDASTAIKILDAELGSLEAPDDRFIAAERLKFFASNETAEALIRFVRKFDASNMDQYTLEDSVARRKAVESLGRQKGAFRQAEVIQLLRERLQDADPYMVEVAVWALGELGVLNENEILEEVASILNNEHVEKRVVIQTLMRADYSPALPKIRDFVTSSNPAVASAAMTAVATLTYDEEVMSPVINILKSDDLNMRRAAIEDITLSKFVPALKNVAVCPNSLVLRSRSVRVLLDVMKERNPELTQILDNETATLVDKLIWDHPGDLDLLGTRKDTRKSRDAQRNIRQLYKNDALHAYAASKCLAEDHRNEPAASVGADVMKSYTDLSYFDYFGSYHVYKTLGWLKHSNAYDLLLDNAKNLPPRFFNHQAGAMTALAELGNKDAVPIFEEIASNSSIWELKYACLVAAERLGECNRLRAVLKEDNDWLVRARANSSLGFEHLRNSFERE